MRPHVPWCRGSPVLTSRLTRVNADVRDAVWMPKKSVEKCRP